MALVFSTLLLKEWYYPRLRWSDVSMSLAYGLPLIPHSLSAWAMNFVDRLLLESRVPLAELGLYTLGYQLGVAMLVLVSSINMAWSPYYYNLMTRQANAERVVRQVSSLYVAVIGGICLVVALFSREIVQLLAPPTYLSAARYAPLILFSYLLEGYYYFVVMPLFFYKKTSWIPLITFSAALVNIVLNLWWIPRWGALGSAWATFVAFLVALLIAYVLGRRWQQINYPLLKLAIANGLIFIGVLLATYPLPTDRYLTELVRKFALLAGFASFAYLWLVKPNLNLLGRGS
jgi:O-antigen/teichoic acid export membrane protein